MQTLIHYFFHFVFPLGIAYWFYKKQLGKVYVLFLLAMLIDLDHLLATPVFQPCRCSIGFHPLHSYWMIGLYVVLFFIPKTRTVALALLLHMLADGIDCLFIEANC